jgi:WD40 repeat protein
MTDDDPDEVGDRPDVFVSYRHRTPHASWVRTVLVPALEADGFTVVLDVKDFTPGSDLVDLMERASRARVTVAVVDETYPAGGYVEFERLLSTRLITVLRDPVRFDGLLQAHTTVDLVGNDDPAPVMAAVHDTVPRVFVLAGEDETDWVAGVLLPSLDSSGVAAEHSGQLERGAVWTESVIDRLLRSDKVVIVLSKAYLREVHARADVLVANAENERQERFTLPVVRDWDIAIPPRYRPVLVIDASRPDLWDTAVAQVCELVGVDLCEPARPGPCPYPGMLPYTGDEARVFFGRQDEIDAVLGGLRRERFVTLIGPSASGKSSLALAGVAPRLRERGDAGGDPWHVETVRVGADPVTAVDQALARWRTDNPDRRLLLVVDQLDELYAAGLDDPGAGERAIAALVDDPAVHVLVTVRADFYGNLISGPLRPLVNRCQVQVVPLTGDGLRDAIRGPARVRKVIVAEALVERLAAETEGQPGLLPFLQETLVTLWDGLRHRLITLEQYRASGDGASTTGIESAIRNVAEGAVARIDGEHEGGERIVRNILVSLVQFGEGRPHTRRQVPVADLVSAAPDEATFRSVFDTLVERRLVTTDTNAAGVLVADLSHEAVIRGWPTLARWVDEDRTTELARRRLLADAEEWDARARAGHPEVGLLQSLDLEDARRWLASADEDRRAVDPPIRRLVEASAAADDRRQRRRLLALAGTFAALVLVAGVLAVLTVNARQAKHQAEQASTERLALQLRSSAAELGDERLALRALLVRAADKLDKTGGGLAEMLATVERAPPIADRRDPPEGVGFDAMWADADRRVLVTGSGDGRVNAWSMVDGVTDRITGHTYIGRTPLAIAGQPGTGLLAVGGGDGSAEQGGFPGSDGAAYLLDTGASSLDPRPLALDGGDSPVSALVFAGGDLVVGRWDGMIFVVDAGSPDAPVRRTLEVPAPDGVPPSCTETDVRNDRKVRALAVDASGRWLAAGTNNCLVLVWDLEALDQPARVLTGHTAKVRALAFVPGTTTLLSSGDDRSIRRWDVGGGTGAGTVLAGAADDQRVIAMCVAPDGRSLVTAGRDHRVRRWTYDGTSLALEPHAYAAHSQTIRSVACLTPRSFASLGADGLVVWNLDGPPRTAERLPIDTDFVARAVAVRPRGGADVAVATTAVSPERGAVVVQREGGGWDTIDLHEMFPLAVAYSADGRYLAVAGNRPTAGDPAAVAFVYDADSLAEKFRLDDGDAATMQAVAVHGLDDLAAGSDDGTVFLRVGGEDAVAAMESGLGVLSAAYLGDHVLVGDQVGTLACYDAARPDRPTGSTTLGRAIAGLAVGVHKVAAGTADGFVAVFADADRGTCDPGSWTRTDIATASDQVTGVALAAKDELALIGTRDGEVELWDIARRRQIGVLAVGTGTDAGTDVMVASAPDASTVVTAAGSVVDVYRLDSDRLQDDLCRLANRELTDDELKAFLPDRGDIRDAARCR